MANVTAKPSGEEVIKSTPTSVGGGGSDLGTVSYELKEMKVEKREKITLPPDVSRCNVPLSSEANS